MSGISPPQKKDLEGFMLHKKDFESFNKMNKETIESIKDLSGYNLIKDIIDKI